MVNICYYSSDFYAPYTGISMYSLCKNNQDFEFRLHCIDTGISEKNKQKMRDVACEFGKELIFHDYKVLEGFIRDELKLPECSGSYATYIKIFPDKIFTDIDSILFMDGDTIINGSLKELFDIDLDPYVFAAVKVPLINERWVYEENRSDNIRLQYALKFQNIGYYNIGVFYANLKRWAEVDFGSKILATKEEHLAKMSSAHDVPIDEMMMNLAVLEHLDENYVYPLSPVFNAVSHNIPFHRGRKAALMCGYIDAALFDKAFYHPIIIHYCIFKPWFTDSYTRYKKEVKYYKALSPWPDAFEDRLYKTPTQKFFGKFIYSLPCEWMMQMAIPLGHCVLRNAVKVKNLWKRLIGVSSVPDSEPEIAVIEGQECKVWTVPDLIADFAFHDLEANYYLDCVVTRPGESCKHQSVFLELTDVDGHVQFLAMNTVKRRDIAKLMNEPGYRMSGAGITLLKEIFSPGEVYTVRLIRKRKGLHLRTEQTWSFAIPKEDTCAHDCECQTAIDARSMMTR